MVTTLTVWSVILQIIDLNREKSGVEISSFEAFLKIIFTEDLFEMCKTQIPRFVDPTGVIKHVHTKPVMKFLLEGL